MRKKNLYSLIKEAELRPSLSVLISHPFIQTNKNQLTDKILTIVKFICTAIEKEKTL